MAQRKSKPMMPELAVPKDATLKQIYAIVKKNFTAADLQRFTAIDEKKMIRGEVVLAELEKIHDQESARRKKKSK